MIFFYHLLILIASSSGLLLSYFVKDKMKTRRYLMLFFLFLGLSMFIHFIIDSIPVPKENFIRYYMNLEPHEDLSLDFLIGKAMELKQSANISG
ncbi:MAG: hypothetical protein JW700_03955 [Candidatus Aenigmarchaeota archaeon]|nr:hypothetical protein [Candidatus Aenigmarchaeota archaeon]